MSGRGPSRPEWSVELAAEFLRRISAGESLRQITADETMPSKDGVYKQIHSDPEFATAYATATQERAACVVDEMIDIADRREPIIVGITEDGCPEAIFPDSKDEIARDRLRIEARRHWAMMVCPEKYGPKVQNTVDLTVTRSAEDLTDDELAAIVSAESGGGADPEA